MPRSRKAAAARRCRLQRSTALVGAVSAAALLLAPAHGAAAPRIMRPGTHGGFFTLGAGPSFFLAPTGPDAPAFHKGAKPFQEPFKHAQAKLTEELGFHFSGQFEGPALGVSVGEAFGEGFFRLQPGVKLWWDIQLFEAAGLYVTPSAKTGMALFVDGDASFAFNVQLGTEARLIFGDRAVVFVRPFTGDLFLGDGVLVNHDIIGGGGFIF